MSCRWYLFTLGVLAAAAVVVCLYDRSQTSLGVGGTPLIVAFIVTDADTDKPIEHATIHIRSTMKSDSDSSEGDFKLVTDENGFASKHYPLVTVTTRTSRLRFTDTWRCYHPYWDFFYVTAPGYEMLEPTDLDSQVKQLRKQVEMPALLVPIRLRKSR